MPKLKLLVLKTDDIERLRDFYASLGFEFVEEQHGSGPRHFSAPMGEGILEVYPLPEGATVDFTTRLGFVANDVHGAVESARRATDVVSEPKQTQWGLRAVVRDPDGRTVELYNE